ncbi:hypothetical protein IWQ62_000485 [Dispira parvispora]|uniref:Fungal-type protein kinase domain-containing protein n=1 Tax=Dispira parvispora TaxID=1520584 RepID=A0A9W8B005_9FUNG|nr:hypothetical protein IWQ62_000485 [Dispira parvispora]
MVEMLTSTSSKLCSWDDSDSYQETSTEITDDIRNREMEHTIERKLQRDVPNLVSKVVGFEELGEYEKVAGKVEDLITLSTGYASTADDDKSPNQQKRRLCKNAAKWLNLGQKGSKTISEHTMYSCIIDYLFLVGMILAEKKRLLRSTTLQRLILPHAERDGRGDPVANICHDIVLRCCDIDVDVQQEYEPFKPDPNIPDDDYRSKKKRKVDKPKPTEGENLDKFRHRVKDVFGFVKVKKSPTDDAKLKTYAKLGWYVRSALNAQFDRNGMWTITVCGPFVRFILFTHSAVISSTRIDVRTVEGRKQFVEDYIRLSICPKYRVGYDPTKTWRPRYERWEVECFNTNRDKNKQGAKCPCASAYVAPKPIMSGGPLFGRRTRCHLASLTKRGKLEYVLKESWTEVDGTLNRVEMPNEVRIFNHIEETDRELETPLTENGIPKMVYGGTVCIRKEYVYGDTGDTGQWCYDTMSRYCGELKTNTGDDSNHNPSTEQRESAKPGNTDNVMKSVERVHQRLLLTPAGKSMTALHPYGTQPSSEVPIELTPGEATMLCGKVAYFFQRLFKIIYRLHEDYGIYHRDLSEGNVLVVETEITHPMNPNETLIVLLPLLIDLDHARRNDDDVTGEMLSRVGTLPFMSILNLAGRTDKLSFLDECESFLYLYLWKCVIGFSRHLIPPPDVRNEKLVHEWASHKPLDIIERTKRNHMHSRDTFTDVVKQLRPEFQRLRSFFHELRHALFTWEGGSGAIVTVVEKTTEKIATSSTNQGTGNTDLQGPASDLNIKAPVNPLLMELFPEPGDSSAPTPTAENVDPILKRFDHQQEVAKKFYTVVMFEYTTLSSSRTIVEG